MLRIIRQCDNCGSEFEYRAPFRKSDGIVTTGNYAVVQIAYICPVCVHPDIVQKNKNYEEAVATGSIETDW